MRLEDLVASEGSLRPIGEALQRLDHPALPIDQGAVAIEAGHFSVRQSPVGRSSLYSDLVRGLPSAAARPAERPAKCGGAKGAVLAALWTCDATCPMLANRSGGRGPTGSTETIN